MFDNLNDRISKIFKSIQGKKNLSESNIADAIKEVRRSLLEADVAIDVVDAFVEQTKSSAIGKNVSEGLMPTQEFVKLVKQELTDIIGKEHISLNLNTQPPAVIMLAGLQGAGKTTSTAKLAKYLQEHEKKKVLVVSADIYRPAAIEQLKILATQIAVEFFPSTVNDKPEKIVIAAKNYAKKNFFDILLVDTAGRLHVDEQMMQEIKLLQKKLNPIETLFVVDAMTGQDAAHTAKKFSDILSLTGVILTKADGDARGGAALSVKYITGKPIKFLGVGEKNDALEKFHPDRLVSSILGMGDMLSLIEEISAKVDSKKAAKSAKKIMSGRFDLESMREQLIQMQKMGGMEALMKKLPAMNNIAANVKKNIINENDNSRMIAIINSMTPKERVYFKLIKGSRKQRIANGSGTDMQQVNKLLKQFEKMQKNMKKMNSGKFQKMMKQTGGLGVEALDFAQINKNISKF